MRTCFIYSALGAIALAMVSGCAFGGERPAERIGAEWYHESRDLYYGIPVHVGFYPANAEVAQDVWRYMESMDLIFNDYNGQSEIAAINQRSTSGSFVLSEELAAAFIKSKRVYELSEGVFDVSCAPVRNVWKTASATGSKPTPEDIAAALALCRFREVGCNGLTLAVPVDGMRFDFGGIVKGIIADEVVRKLKAAQVQGALIQVGGETTAFGLSEHKRTFRIAIQHPRNRSASWTVIQTPLQGISASTSGNYEQPILIGGKAYYHIMDPRTGRPALTNVISVSIVFPETGKNWLADSLSTAGVLLGPEKTFKIVQRLGGDALFLVQTPQGIREVKSQGWERYRL